MTMEQKMDFLIEGMQELRGDVQELKSDVQQLKGDVQELKNCTQSLENGFQELQEKVGHLEGEVRGVRLHLENVTDANIMRVAEGHDILWRRFVEVLKNSERDELRDIRINILEGDVRRMKEKLMMI